MLKNGFETANSRVFALGRAANPDFPAGSWRGGASGGTVVLPAVKRTSSNARLAPDGRRARIAEIGLSEREALARGGAQIARAAFSDAEPADLSGGFVKLFADRKGKLLRLPLWSARIGAYRPSCARLVARAHAFRISPVLPLAPGSASEAIRLAAASPARGLLRSSKVQRAFRFFRFFG